MVDTRGSANMKVIGEGTKVVVIRGWGEGGVHQKRAKMLVIKGGTNIVVLRGGAKMLVIRRGGEGGGLVQWKGA